MVYLNKNIFINIKSLEFNILKIVEDKVQNELYYVDNITDEKKERIKINILKEVKMEIRKDNFIYRSMADNRCIFKHKNGKNDGHFCHKNITKNGDSKNFLCTKHNKNHIPSKKRLKENKKQVQRNNNIINNNIVCNIRKIDSLHIIKSKLITKKNISLKNNINNNIFRKKFNFYKYYYILNENEKVKYENYENEKDFILDSKKDERTILYNYHNNIHKPFHVF